ncbi:MAG TPA: LysR substrate-binding domain-containing protein, partial [Polyangiaceae bacterium]|nr:LysR substrate-binding domain-containing protein [Polyangiaceae bacterium]
GQSYLGRHGQPRSVRELGAHAWLSYDTTLDHIPDAQWLRQHVPSPRFSMRTNQTVTLVAACAAGHGLAILPTAFELADARLVRLLPRASLPTRDMWMVFHHDLRTNARVTALGAWLVEVFASEARTSGN